MKLQTFVASALFMMLITIGCSKDDDDKDSVGTFTLSGSAGKEGSGLVNVSPSVAKMTVYKFAVSKSANCSDPIVVIDNGDTPENVDMNKGPNLGSGKLEDGEYPCVIMEMSDELSFTPAKNEGACKTSEAVLQDICSPQGEGVETSTKLIDGTSKVCTNKKERVALYLSTLSTVENGADSVCEADRENCVAFLPPTSAIKVRGIKLGEPLVVKGDTAGVFVMDVTDKLSGKKEDGTENDSCELQPPAFSFEM